MRHDFGKISQACLPVGALCSVHPGGSGGGAPRGLCVDLSILYIDVHTMCNSLTLEGDIEQTLLGLIG